MEAVPWLCPHPPCSGCRAAWSGPALFARSWSCLTVGVYKRHCGSSSGDTNRRRSLEDGVNIWSMIAGKTPTPIMIGNGIGNGLLATLDSLAVGVLANVTLADA